MDIHQARTESTQEEMKAKMDIHQKKMDTWLVEIKTWRKETTACQEMMEASLGSKEPTPLETMSIAKQQEVPKRLKWNLPLHWRADMGTGIQQ
jgi:hypothetical protein